jgi:endonuclease YncB( thermonuclease family)
VYLEDRDINLELIREGYAREYTYKTEYSKQTIYKQTERQAYELKLGLWGLCDLEV